MRKTLITATLAAGIGLATAMAAPAFADATDDAFLAALDQKGIQPPSPEEAVSLGHEVCAALSSGSSLTDQSAVVSQKTGLSAEDGGFFVGAAAASYCPDQAP